MISTHGNVSSAVRKLWAGSVIVVGGVVCWACCW